MLAAIGTRRRERSAWRVATMVAVGLACYVAVAWPVNRLARQLAGEPRAAIVSHKLDFLRAHPTDYDVILVGSSRVHYDVEPAVVDTGLREAGCPVRVFNFGVPGLTAAEQSWLTAKLAEVGRSRWKAVLIERPQLPLRTLRFVGSGRHRMGHLEPGQVWLSAEALATSTRSRLDAAVDIAEVALGYLYYQLGPGQLSALIEAKPATVPDEGFRIDLSRDGFVPLEEEVSPLLQARTDRMDWAEFAQRLEALRATPPTASPLTPARLDHLSTQIADARRIAPEVALLLLPQAAQPTVDDSASIAQAAESGALGDVTALNLGDPVTYPELFADGIWYDDDHVMGDGTRRVSLELGRQMCKALPVLRGAAD